MKEAAEVKGRPLLGFQSEENCLQNVIHVPQRMFSQSKNPEMLICEVGLDDDHLKALQPWD